MHLARRSRVGGGRPGFALGDLVTGVARMLKTALANLDRPQPQRGDTVRKKVASEPVLGSAKRASRHFLKTPWLKACVVQ